MSNFTCRDASGSFSWITEGVLPSQIDDDGLGEWADTIISQSIESATYSIQERAEQMTFPKMGYSTTHIYQNAEDYIAQKTEEAESEIKSERSEIISYLQNWMSE